ncbi:hypothetical protein B0A55_09694 [Friedmanniomyces simplex]|uniref:Major facilitator superfamily (MFS) profile domain-containing protein n=1 Tax=Friedmanniomyces simplex TaxID=329884 RepID=A0A4U0WT10_9PEZI|nr:hypothetical protein B0A55_09694 [Friedmanniomyces simplex]
MSTPSTATTLFNSVTSLISHGDSPKEIYTPYHVLDAVRTRHLEVDAIGTPPTLRYRLICLVEFFTTVISNSGSSVVDAAMRRLGVGRLSTICCLTTVYLLGQGVGGLVLPAITESFGSKYIYIASTFGYALMCLIIGLAPSLATVTVCRLLSGILSAMPTVVAKGTIENIWDTSERVWMIYLLSLSRTVALSIVFNLAAIVLGLLALLCCFMNESRPALVLQHHIRVLQKSTHFPPLHPATQFSRPTLSSFTTTTILLPLRLFLTSRTVFATSLLGVTVVSIPYLLAEALPVVYTTAFHFSPWQTSLVFLALAAGCFPTVLTRLYDHHVTTTRHRVNEPVQPEDKLTGFLLAAPLVAAGLWWFGASVPPLMNTTPWLSIPNLLPLGFTSLEFDYVLSGFLTDLYGPRAASANAAMCFLRAVVGAVYPLFGREFFSSDRFGGASGAAFVLAGVGTGYCGVAGWFWGRGRGCRFEFGVEVGEEAVGVQNKGARGVGSSSA